MTSRTDSRIRSTPSPARNASSSSDATDWDTPSVGTSLVSTCRYTPRIPPMAHSLRQAHRPPETPPHPGTLTSPHANGSCLAQDHLLGALDRLDSLPAK